MRAIILLLIAGLSTQSVTVQKRQIDQTNSSLVILGTSSLHNWEIQAEQFTSTASIQAEENQLIIESLQFNAPVKGLKSGKGAMDDNTYKALKAKEYPTITYVLKEVKQIRPISTGYIAQTVGSLTIAGVTKSVNMDVDTRVSDKIEFTGELTFAMSEYGVEPPTALFGTIKTGDEVTVKFNVEYK